MKRTSSKNESKERSYRELYSALSQRIKVLNRKVAGGVVIAGLIIGGSLFYFTNNANAAYIVIDGQEIGLVANEAAGKSLVQSVLEESGQAVKQTAKTKREIEYQRVRVDDSTLLQESVTKEELKDQLDPYVEGYALQVAGKAVAVLPTSEDAAKVLSDLKNYYAQPSDSKNVTSVEFEESVATAKVEAQPEQIQSPDEVLALLQKGNENVQEYTVQDKDSLWLIARKNNMLIEEVLKSNPNLTEDTVLQPGQKLKLASITPYINVISKGEYSATETLPYTTIRTTDYNLASGKTQIKQQGSNGSKVVTYSFVQKNDQIIEKTVLEEKKLKEPVDKVIVQGPNAPKAKQPTQIVSSQLSVSRSADKVSRLIDNALSLKGIPYVWGGATPKGFDCSGYVQYVFKSVGISLPRTSFDQYKVGIPVSRDKLQPGDLVFFNTYARAGDVRIYIGGGQTIGAANDGVTLHSLSESYWSSRYLGARRIPI